MKKTVRQIRRTVKMKKSKERLKNMINTEIIKEIRNAPDLKNVETIYNDANELELTFKTDSERNGSELKTVCDILFKHKIYSFIKSEKVDYWSNNIKQIKIFFN